MMDAVATETPLGTKIRKRRQELGMTQQALADRVGVDRTTVTNWEKGKHFPQRYLGKVEAVLDIDLEGGRPPELVSRELRGQILRERGLSPEDAARVIGLIEQTLRESNGATSPGAETAQDQRS